MCPPVAQDRGLAGRSEHRPSEGGGGREPKGRGRLVRPEPTDFIRLYGGGPLGRQGWEFQERGETPLCGSRTRRTGVPGPF
jgi:hypothetical protein